MKNLKRIAAITLACCMMSGGAVNAMQEVSVRQDTGIHVAREEGDDAKKARSTAASPLLRKDGSKISKEYEVMQGESKGAEGNASGYHAAVQESTGTGMSLSEKDADVPEENPSAEENVSGEKTELSEEDGLTGEDTSRGYADVSEGSAKTEENVTGEDLSRGHADVSKGNAKTEENVTGEQTGLSDKKQKMGEDADVQDSGTKAKGASSENKKKNGSQKSDTGKSKPKSAKAKKENKISKTTSRLHGANGTDGTEIEINNKSFPLESWYFEHMDKNKDGKLSKEECSKVKKFRDAVFDPYKSLEFLKFFPNLEKLEISQCTSEHIDLSQNKKLKTVIISGGHAKLLDLSVCKDLQEFELLNSNVSVKVDFSNLQKLEKVKVGWFYERNDKTDDNKPFSLTFSNNPSLKLLDVERKVQIKGFSALTGLETLHLNMANEKELDVAPFKKLKLLSLYGFKGKIKMGELSGKLEKLYLYDCEWKVFESLSLKNLKDLSIYGNEKNLDFSELKNLEELDCYNSSVDSLILPNSKNLKKIDCGKNNLKTLDLSGLSNLQELKCNRNKLTSLDLSSAPNLVVLDVGKNSLTSLDLSKQKDLVTLRANKNSLTSLDLSENKKLQKLYCSYNKLDELDVSNLKDLYYLQCNQSKLKKLKVDNTGLKKLYCKRNKLTKLDLSGCKELYRVSCGKNKIEELDVSMLSGLWWINCEKNGMKRLYLPKGYKGGRYETGNEGIVVK